MSRWHKASCTEPDVFADGNTPRCRSCQSCPDIQQLVAQHVCSNTQLTVPPDEHFGELNLYWPECVPYEGSTEVSALHRSEEHTDQTGRIYDLYSSTDVSTFPNIYKATLRGNEFRVLCLPAVEDSDTLIHVELETYRRDACPEYETTSYAWGGEDGDNTSCYPIFVGEYWDILLQTKNCWSMLRYLRPTRGLRIVWVDAICIDQSNVLERNAQVAQMSAIYRGCSRVFVYLGEEISQMPLRRPGQAFYPYRRNFHEIGEVISESTMDLQKLLGLRYFSRVWIIQELLLAPSAVFPVLGTEFIAVGLTPARLTTTTSQWTWDALPTPWLQYIFSGGFPMKDSLFKILKPTWNSRASDPRDKIFGIHGLIQNKSISDVLKPDYSISTLHMFIGIFCYTLLTLKRTELLLIASGQSVGQVYASWLPDWERRETWQEIFQWPEISGKHSESSHSEERRQKGQEVSMDESESSAGSLDSRINETIQKSYQRSIFLQEIRMKRVRTASDVIFQIYAIEELDRMWDVAHKHLQFSRISKVTYESLEICWDFDPYVNRTSSGLSIHLLHLFTTSSRPVKVDLPSTANLFKFPTKHCELFIHTPAILLDQAIGSEPTEVFLLPEKNYSRALVLFMRKTVTDATYRMIKCCICYDLFLKAEVMEEEKSIRDFGANYYHFQYQHTLHETLTLVVSMVGDLDRRLQKMELYRGQKACDLRTLNRIFLNKSWRVKDLLPLFQALIDEFNGSNSYFNDRYVELLSKHGSSCRPIVELDKSWPTEYLDFIVSSDEWNAQISDSDDFLKDGWEYGDEHRWIVRRQSAWKTIQMLFKMQKGLHYHIRIMIEYVKLLLSETWLYDVMKVLSPYRRLTGEDESTMLLRGPRFEDHFIIDWEQAAVDKFRADGRIVRVNIV